MTRNAIYGNLTPELTVRVTSMQNEYINCNITRTNVAAHQIDGVRALPCSYAPIPSERVLSLGAKKYETRTHIPCQ